MGPGEHSMQCRCAECDAIHDLLDRAAALRDQVDTLTDPSRPLLRRLLSSGQALALINQAEALLAEARARVGLPPLPPEPPQRWLGMGRTGWERLQWMIGIHNSYWFWCRLNEGATALALFSLSGVFVVACWRLPRR
jgi:hypothetical protein